MTWAGLLLRLELRATEARVAAYFVVAIPIMAALFTFDLLAGIPAYTINAIRVLAGHEPRFQIVADLARAAHVLREQVLSILGGKRWD